MSIGTATWSSGSSIKSSSALAARYAKLTANYLAFVKLACTAFGCAFMSSRRKNETQLFVLGCLYPTSVLVTGRYGGVAFYTHPSSNLHCGNSPLENRHIA
jgi:hypothetical protein